MLPVLTSTIKTQRALATGAKTAFVLRAINDGKEGAKTSGADMSLHAIVVWCGVV